MKTPLLPGSRSLWWTIVHESGDIIPGNGHGVVAFTSRAAFDAWAQGIIVLPDNAWHSGPPSSVFHTEVASLTPNHDVLVLEEAWGWKFPTQCPKMHSAQDGLRVLERLLKGKPLPEWAFSSRTTWMPYSLYERQDPVLLFITAWQERVEWEEHRRLEQWKADAVVGPGGKVLFLRDVEYDWVTLVGKDWNLSAFLDRDRVVLDNVVLDPPLRNSPLHEGDELMILEGAPICDDLWSPQKATRHTPAYLGALV